MNTGTIKSTIGRTWFSIDEEDDQFVLESRDYGDVGEETAGQTDITEAKRILAALRAAGVRCSAEVVDEWVIVTVPKPFHQVVVGGRPDEGYEGRDEARAKEVYDRSKSASERENKGRLVTWYCDTKLVEEFVPRQPAAPIHNPKFPTV